MNEVNEVNEVNVVNEVNEVNMVNEGVRVRGVPRVLGFQGFRV